MADREYLICILMGMYLDRHPIAPFKDIAIFLDQQLQKMNMEPISESDKPLFDRILQDCYFAYQANNNKSLMDTMDGKPKDVKVVFRGRGGK